MYRELGDRQGEAIAANNIGNVRRDTGQHGEAAIASGAGAPGTPLHMAALPPGAGIPDPPESAT